MLAQSSGVGVVVERFDRYPALIIDFLESIRDCIQIGRTLPGTTMVNIVAMKMSNLPAMFVDRCQWFRPVREPWLSCPDANGRRGG